MQGDSRSMELMQTQGQNQIARPFAPLIDFNADIHQAYWNCINALNTFQVGSGPVIPGYVQAGMVMKAEVAFERFEGCVSILETMILEEWKDEDYKKVIKEIKSKDNRWSLKQFHAITELLHRKEFFAIKTVPHARI